MSSTNYTLANIVSSGAKGAVGGAILEGMANELLDSTSERLAWLRKKKKLTQKALGRAVGVGHVYISQLEGGTRNASRALLGALAQELGTSRAFLEMETDDPTPLNAAAAEKPCYFSEEADAGATIIDAMHPRVRALAVAMLQTLHEHCNELARYAPDEPEPIPGALGGRLILGKLVDKTT